MMKTLLPWTLLVALATPASAQQFVVTDYGATVTPGDDDAPGIRLALSHATAYLMNSSPAPSEDATLVFPPGSYDLKTPISGPPARPFCLYVRGLDSKYWLNIEGDAVLRNQVLKDPTFDDAVQTIGIYDSKRVRISGLTFENEPLPLCDGTVTDVVAATSTSPALVTVDFERGLLPSDFPMGPKDNPILHWGGLVDPTFPGRVKANSATFYLADSVSIVPGSPPQVVYGLLPKQGIPIDQDFANGDRFSYHFRGGGNVIHIRGDNSGGMSEDIVLENLYCTSTASMFVNAEHVDGLTVSGCSIDIEPGHWRSANGDGVHVKRSNDVRIEGSFFQGLFDDSINLTEVTDFTVIGNSFRNVRRHAVLFDGDDRKNADGTIVNPANSSDGLITLNTCTFAGGSFVSHNGGTYDSVAIHGNTAAHNNLSRAAGRNYRIQLESQAGALVLGADVGPGGAWNAGDRALMLSPGNSPRRQWHMQEFIDDDHPTTEDRVFLQHRASRDSSQTLYLDGADPAVNVQLGSPTGDFDQENPDSQAWVCEPTSTEGWVRLRNYDNDLYLGIDETGPAALPGNDLHLEPFASGDSGQIWRIVFLED